ncbi:LCP family protein [Aerococcaceae bacterium WGS1372]
MKRFFTKNGKFSLWKTIRNIFIVVILFIAAVSGYMYGNVLTAVNTANQEVNVTNIRDTEISIEAGDPINVLVVGTDGGGPERQEDDGYVSRSDTLMLINLNPETGTTKMVSIPRDTLANIEGLDEPDKINHAYAYGGIDLTIETVQDFLQIPIDYYAVVNMDGLAEMIDALGGIEVTSPLSFEYRGTEFHKGETRQVDGVKAMNFARMRYDDPEGEVGRQNRQKIVIKAIIDKALSLDAVAQYPRLIKVASEYIMTNVNLNEALSIYQQYLPALKNISSVQFESLEEIYMDEVFYFHIPLNARVKVANEFRYLSNMPTITTAQLANPLDGEDNLNRAKSLAAIINQYPTGLSEEEIQEIYQRQSDLESARESTYVEPVQEVVEQPYYPPVMGTEDDYNYEEPAEHYPPQESEQPSVEPTPPVESQAPAEEIPKDPVESAPESSPEYTE